MLQRMKIGYRLSAGFALLVVLMFALIAVGVHGIRSIHKDLDAIVTVNNDRVRAVTEMTSVIRDVAVMIRDLVLNPDPAGVEAGIQRIAARRAVYNKNFDKLEALGLVSNDKSLAGAKSRAEAIIAKVREEQLKAGPLNNQVIELCRSGNTREAAALLNDEAAPAVGDLIDTLQGLSDFEREMSDLGFNNAQASYRRSLVALGVMAALIIIIAIVTAAVLTRGIVKPLHASVAAAELIAEGNLTVRIDSTGTDEISQLVRAMMHMTGKLRGVLGQIKSASDTMASASTQLSSSSEEISATSHDQSGRSQQIATAAEQLTQTVMDVAHNASGIAESAENTVNQAREGDHIVEASVKEIREIATAVSGTSKVIGSLHERSKQIGEIVKVINDIADQTNLLALNAAIEAARAGEQGRGFAVVADEVRKLAERTARATSEIGGMIASIQREVDESVGSMKGAITKVDTGVELSIKAGQQLKHIVSSISDLQGLVQQIASATEEMSSVAGTIGTDVSSIADSSREVSSGTVQIAQSASELSTTAHTLKTTMEGFKI